MFKKRFLIYVRSEQESMQQSWPLLSTGDAQVQSYKLYYNNLAKTIPKLKKLKTTTTKKHLQTTTVLSLSVHCSLWNCFIWCVCAEMMLLICASTPDHNPLIIQLQMTGQVVWDVSPLPHSSTKQKGSDWFSSSSAMGVLGFESVGSWESWKQLHSPKQYSHKRQ